MMSEWRRVPTAPFISIFFVLLVCVYSVAQAVQIDSFDDIAATGWFEQRATGYMKQSTEGGDPCEHCEGTGAMRIKFEDFNDPLWDEVPGRLFTPPNLFDVTPIDSRALTFWVWSDLVAASRVHQLIIYQAGGTARFDVPLATTPGWRKVVCPISQFYYRTDWGDSPVTDFSKIDHIDFWCSTYNDLGNSIYIDDLQLEGASDTNEPEGQINISRVEQMPNIPSPYVMRDWKQVALDYDAFVFDFSKTGDYLPLIWWDTTRINFPMDNFGLPDHVGRFGQTGANAHGATTCMGAVLGATLVGIDKSNQNGYNWVLMLENYFSISNGLDLYLENIPGVTGVSFWYTTLANIFFYQLHNHYPGVGNMDSEFITVADRWYDACVVMGGNTNPWTVPNFNYTDFDFSTMTPVDNGVWQEPDSSAAIGWLEYMAYINTGDPNYLDAADWCMQYIENSATNPNYDMLHSFSPIVAVRMNVDQGRNYDVSKFINWCFENNYWGWSIKANSWGGYDCAGLASTDFYAFEMESLIFAGNLVPVVRYDQRYARAIGKYILNLANSLRLFYPNSLPDTHQTSAAWAHAYDPDYCIGYEGLKKELLTHERTQSDYSLIYGTIISGSHSSTHTANYIYEVLEEETLAGGKDALEHVWDIPIADGYFHQIVIKAHISDGGDADNGFSFSYATNPGGPYTYLFTVNSTTDVYNWQLLSGVSGTVYVKVEDTDRTVGNSLHDRLYVDEIYIDTRNNTIGPYASGDALTYGWGQTDLGLYGSSYIGILGGMVSTTNVDKILQLDLLKTDYYHDTAYPTYLYYNPYNSEQTVDINVGSNPVDIYDTVSKTFLATNVTNDVNFSIHADSAVVAVLAPAAGTITMNGSKKLIDDVVVDYRANQTYDTCGQVQASPYRLRADLDGNCRVDMSDLAELTGKWLVIAGSLGRADINDDGEVDFGDFAELGLLWSQCNDPEGSLPCAPNW